MRLREKMETYYQKEKQIVEQSQPEVSIPQNYINEFSLKDKENIFKDIYSSMYQFNKIFYEAKRELKLPRDSINANRTV